VETATSPLGNAAGVSATVQEHAQEVIRNIEKEITNGAEL